MRVVLNQVSLERGIPVVVAMVPSSTINFRLPIETFHPSYDLAKVLATPTWCPTCNLSTNSKHPASANLLCTSGKFWRYDKLSSSFFKGRHPLVLTILDSYLNLFKINILLVVCFSKHYRRKRRWKLIIFLTEWRNLYTNLKFTDLRKNDDFSMVLTACFWVMYWL